MKVIFRRTNGPKDTQHRLSSISRRIQKYISRLLERGDRLLAGDQVYAPLTIMGAL